MSIGISRSPWFSFWWEGEDSTGISQKGHYLTTAEAVAQHEELQTEFIRQGVASGMIVIPANAGTSSDYGNIDTELVEMGVAIGSGADTVMDL